ncbi:MAG TPA: hypothetical protein VHU89_02900 [Acidobacteriaceae bacterium]|jgi:hypothetical protein|nr:hypothetical protein [Acidobacteriaceae bacterium]
MTMTSPNPPSSWRAAQTFLARQDMKLGRWREKSLHRRNLHDNAPVVGSERVHVSMTTHGKRIETVYLAIESIANGESLPARLILWLDDPRLFADLPDSLRRLRDRGLEICLTQNFGPHTKYYPYLLGTDSLDVPLVTADDDVLYGRWWLRGLIGAWRQNRAVVNCYRAHVVQVEKGVIQPYRTWGHCTSTVPSYRHFATGVSGCIYPSALLQQVKTKGDTFAQVCPRADDIWLHVNALRHGFAIRQILRQPLNFPGVLDTQDVGLFRSNTVSGNDEQVCSTYTSEDIAHIDLFDGTSAAAFVRSGECLS